MSVKIAELPKNKWIRIYTRGSELLWETLDDGSKKKEREEAIKEFIEKWNKWANDNHKIYEDDVEAMEEYLKNIETPPEKEKWEVRRVNVFFENGEKVRETSRKVAEFYAKPLEEKEWVKTIQKN